MTDLLCLTLAGATGFMLGMGAMLKHGYPLPGTRTALIDSAQRGPRSPIRYAVCLEGNERLFVEELFYSKMTRHIWMRCTFQTESALQFRFRFMAQLLTYYLNCFAYQPFKVIRLETIKTKE